MSFGESENKKTLPFDFSNYHTLPREPHNYGLQPFNHSYSLPPIPEGTSLLRDIFRPPSGVEQRLVISPWVKMAGVAAAGLLIAHRRKKHLS